MKQILTILILSLLSYGSFANAQNFSGQNLRGAIFVEKSLRDADFSNTNLQNAKFQFTDLKGANFNGADLRGAILYVIMEGQYYRFNNLQGASFVNAIVTQGMASFLQGEGFSGMIIDYHYH